MVHSGSGRGEKYFFCCFQLLSDIVTKSSSSLWCCMHWTCSIKLDTWKQALIWTPLSDSISSPELVTVLPTVLTLPSTVWSYLKSNNNPLSTAAIKSTLYQALSSIRATIKLILIAISSVLRFTADVAAPFKWNIWSSGSFSKSLG